MSVRVINKRNITVSCGIQIETQCNSFTFKTVLGTRAQSAHTEWSPKARIQRRHRRPGPSLNTPTRGSPFGSGGDSERSRYKCYKYVLLGEGAAVRSGDETYHAKRTAGRSRATSWRAFLHRQDRTWKRLLQFRNPWAAAKSNSVLASRWMKAGDTAGKSCFLFQIFRFWASSMSWRFTRGM